MSENVRSTTVAQAGSAAGLGEGVDRRRLAWQIVATSLLPLVSLAWLGTRQAWSLWVLYLLLMPFLLWMAYRYGRMPAAEISERFQHRNGAGVFLFFAAIFVGVSALPVYNAWTEDSLDKTAAEAQRVTGIIPAEPFVVGSVRDKTSYLKIADVLLSCHTIFEDDCPPVRRHAGLRGEILYQTNQRGRHVVYEVWVDGKLLRAYADQAAFYRAEHQRTGWQLLVVVLTLGLPQLWLWQRARRMFREAPEAAGETAQG